jgi:hypothetical protein
MELSAPPGWRDWLKPAGTYRPRRSNRQEGCSVRAGIHPDRHIADQLQSLSDLNRTLGIYPRLSIFTQSAWAGVQAEVARTIKGKSSGF